MGFADFFANDFETRENSSNQKLISRHYRSDYQKAKAAVMKAMENIGMAVVEVNEEYHEIRSIASKQEMIVEIFSKGFFDQQVDVKVNTNYLISRGRGLKLIEKFYGFLDRNLTKME